MTQTSSIEDLLRELTPQVLGAVARRYGDIDDAEDAVQEALLAAATQWPAEGVPDNPPGWLIAVAARRMTDRLRREGARRRREVVAASREPAGAPPPLPDRDDSLTLLFLCCHPALTQPSAIALRASYVEHHHRRGGQADARAPLGMACCRRLFGSRRRFIRQQSE